MKVPINWLKDYVDINVSPKDLGDALTLSGSKVEEVIVTGDVVENVVTGKILKIEKHPEAERLSICQVDIGKEGTIQIVTAASNMKEGDIVPTALHGSTLADGTKIKKGKLRGEVSNGMFCSEEELGIAGDKPVHGLMILPTEAPIGKDIKEVVKMQKAIIDFEITSNRPDCLSIIGIARETAATLGKTYKLPNFNYKATCGERVEEDIRVEVRDSLCRRYMAKGIKNIKIKPSPQWMQERLIEAGVRPINNIVDITNFVMIEMGQPMHAFDRREITSNIIVVERAYDGEKFTTLDGEERVLDSSMLNIKDGDTTIGLAGIMGGLNSEVKADTKEVIFECANFDGTNIRISSKKLALRTEASGKFEKDLDPNLAEMALDRACALVEEIGAGEIMEGTIDIYPEKIKSNILKVDSLWVNKFLGINISKEDMKEYLNRLDIKTDIENEDLVIAVPTFRSDINIKEDVAEEIARIYGYNKVPSTIPSTQTERTGKSHKQILSSKLVDTLIASGLNQAITYSFVSPKVFDKVLIKSDSILRKVVAIKNPLGEDYSIMRTTTIPSIMEALSRNYARNNEIVRLFEIGKIYLPKEDPKELPEERNILTIAMYGEADYYDIKGIVENVLVSLGIENAKFQRETNNDSYHPGKTASIVIKKEQAGIVGEIHPQVAENYEVEKSCYIAEINLDVLFKYAKLDKKYIPLPKFPAVTRDLAVIIDENVLVQDIEDIIKNQGGAILESAKLFDVYRGKQIPEGKKSIAYSFVYRGNNKTLTDNEVNKVHDKILKALENKLGAELR